MARANSTRRFPINLTTTPALIECTPTHSKRTPSELQAKQPFQDSKTSSTPRLTMATCKIPHNQPIYHALINKAEHEKQIAADYKAVAEALLTWNDNLVVKYYEMRDDIISFITDEYPLDGCTSEIASFIEMQLDALTSKMICRRCTPKGYEPRCYCDNPPY